MLMVKALRARGHPVFAERFLVYLRVNHSKELKMMRRRESRIYNGLTTY